VPFTCADAEQQIATAFQQACDKLGEDFRYAGELEDTNHVVRFPHFPPFLACVLTLWTVARRGIGSLYDPDSITDDDQIRLRTSSITIPTC
jgi:hypothetical protein